MKTLGGRIRELREAKDISLRELARKLDLSAAFLSDIELGRRYPSAKVLSQIARKLEVEVEELQEYDTRPPVEDLRRLAQSNPAFGLAFRRVIDKLNVEKISPEKLLRLIGERREPKRK